MKPIFVLFALYLTITDINSFAQINQTKVQLQSYISGTPVKSTDGSFKGIFYHYNIEYKVKLSDQEGFNEFQALAGQTKPEWGIYDGDPEKDGRLLAIGKFDSIENKIPVFFMTVYNNYPGQPRFTYHLCKIYAVNPNRITVKDTIIMHQLEPDQKILIKTQVKIDNIKKGLFEVNFSEPSIKYVKEFLSQRLYQKAIQLMQSEYMGKTNAFKPPWGLYYLVNWGDSINGLEIEGKIMNTKVPIIIYDNSSKRCTLIDPGIYESNGKGNLKLESSK